MLWFVLNSAGCPDLDRIQCTVSLTACSGILYILPCVQGPKLMEITPWRCFRCGQLPGVTEAICLHALSSMGDEGTAVTSGSSPQCANVALQWPLHLFEWESAEDQHYFTNVQTAAVLWTLLNKHERTVGSQYSHAFPCPPCMLWSREDIVTTLSTESWVLLLVAGSQVLQLLWGDRNQSLFLT